MCTSVPSVDKSMLNIYYNQLYYLLKVHWFYNTRKIISAGRCEFVSPFSCQCVYYDQGVYYGQGIYYWDWEVVSQSI